MFIIIPIIFTIACAVWLGYCVGIAGRGIAVKIIAGVIGGALFILIQGIIPMIFQTQMRSLLRMYDDPIVIIGIFVISAGIIFGLGLLLRKFLNNSRKKRYI